MENLLEIIMNLAKNKEKIKTSDVLGVIKNKFSRAYVSKIINRLVKEGKLLKGGRTAGSFYVLPENRFLVEASGVFKKTYARQGLEEHLVLDELINTNLYIGLRDNVKSIFNYAFSEMLNNAIEHSDSKEVGVEVMRSKGVLIFSINDQGVGAFRNIMKKKKLASEIEAIQDLLKGKTTTLPQAHTGEGIFFTSRVSDKFILESYEYKLIIDNIAQDIFVGENKPANKGTRVTFVIALDTKKHLVDIFKKYQTSQDTMAFDKTEVRIRLYTMGTVHVSRSQARRVLSGLEKFKSVVLDFEKVPMIGQGFADELFRVYKKSHPEVELKPVNMNTAVKFMIERVSKTDE